jgi:hypothetical protein
MAIQSFFSGLSDTDLAKEVIANRPDVYIQRYVFIGSGVINITVPSTTTLTPATSPVWTVDSLISTVAKNLLIVDKNGKVASAMITDNTATSLTFDSTACKLEEDETTVASFTAAATCDFYVLTPSSVADQLYGPFMGYAEGLELNITQEKKYFKHGLPRQKKFGDLVEVTGTISGGNINWTNKDILQSIFNATEYGKNTAGEISYGIGTGGGCNEQGNFYRMTFVGEDRNCRTYYIVARKLQFAANGNLLSESADGYMMANFTGDLLSDSFYPSTADLVHVKRMAT